MTHNSLANRPTRIPHYPRKITPFRRRLGYTFHGQRQRVASASGVLPERSEV